MRGIYLAGGYPDVPTFLKSYAAVVGSGFDFIEVGMPFNDPIADGPVIAGAIHESIRQGVTPQLVIDSIRSMKKGEITTYVMTYANVMYAIGMKKFSDIMGDRLAGVIIPDLPNRMARFFSEQGLAIPIVPFATLETRESDMELMNKSKSEILYFVGVRGITGSKSDFSSQELVDKIRMIKQNTNKKVIIGFGIKNGDDARQALALGDGYVVGTEAVRRQKEPEKLKEYLKTLNGKG